VNPALLAVALQQAPAIIAMLQKLFHKANPNEPEPTEAEVIAAYNLAFISSLARDDAWIAAHPDA
jgi:hypothetical protein